MMLSPLTIRVPNVVDWPSSATSSAFSRARFMCWSNPCRFPRITFPPFSLMRTTFPMLVSSSFTAMSTDKIALPCAAVWIHLFKLSLSSALLKKWVLSHRDSSEEISRIEASLGVALSLPKSAQAQCAEPEDGVVFVSLDGFEFVRSEGVYVPFLGSPPTLALFPTPVGDEGAIRFLLTGADVMRPGIRRMDDWGGAGRTVVVKEEKKGRAVAVGTSLVPVAEARGMEKGGCVKNLHHVGDRYWNLHKAL